MKHTSDTERERVVCGELWDGNHGKCSLVPSYPHCANIAIVDIVSVVQYYPSFISHRVCVLLSLAAAGSDRYCL